MSFYQEETIYCLQGSEIAYFLQGKALQEINCFRSLQEINKEYHEFFEGRNCKYPLFKKWTTQIFSPRWKNTVCSLIKTMDIWFILFLFCFEN